MVTCLMYGGPVSGDHCPRASELPSRVNTLSTCKYARHPTRSRLTCHNSEVRHSQPTLDNMWNPQAANSVPEATPSHRKCRSDRKQQQASDLSHELHTQKISLTQCNVHTSATPHATHAAANSTATLREGLPFGALPLDGWSAASSTAPYTRREQSSAMMSDNLVKRRLRYLQQQKERLQQLCHGLQV